MEGKKGVPIGRGRWVKCNQQSKRSKVEAIRIINNDATRGRCRGGYSETRKIRVGYGCRRR